MILIVPENHAKEEDKAFTDKAKLLAGTGKIILVLEGGIFQDHEKGMMSKNVVAAEDRFVWLYSHIFQAFCEFYSILPLLEKLLDAPKSESKESMDIVENVYNNVLKFLDRLLKIDSYELPEPYVGFMDILDKEINDDKAMKILFLDESTKVEKSNALQKYSPNIKDALKKHALQVSKYLKQSKSSKIKEQVSLSDVWINDVFSKPETFFRKEFKEINTDEVVVNLRNQVFVERLGELWKENSQMQIWLVVGSEHVPGILLLLQHQYPALKFQKVDSSEKTKLIEGFVPVAPEDSKLSLRPC